MPEIPVRIHAIPHQLLEFFRFRETPRPGAIEYDHSIHLHLENAPGSGNQRYLPQNISKREQEFLGQPTRTENKSALTAIMDANTVFHGNFQIANRHSDMAIRAVSRAGGKGSSEKDPKKPVELETNIAHNPSFNTKQTVRPFSFRLKSDPSHLNVVEKSYNSEQPVKHVAVIMDGNGRWANRRGLPRDEGHRKGVENVEKIVEKAGELNIRYLTLYAFSAENWKRPPSEVNALMNLLESFLKKQRKQLLKNEIRLHTIGRIEQLPEKVYNRLVQVKEDSSHFPDHHLILALNYGARNEVLDAVERFSASVKEGGESLEHPLTWETFSKYLDTAEFPDPELIIRTSGEFRVSNFLLMQGAYSEYHFSPVCWPDFGPELFEAALADYQNRERRFGKTGQQIEEEKLLSLKSSGS